ncbi:MAG: DMT family transporter [Tepidisphaerales bacterium]
MPRTLLPILILVLCCLLWGWSFPTMQVISHAVEVHTIGHAEPTVVETLASRALINGIRFLLAGLLYLAITARYQHGFCRADVVGGLAVGVFFGGGMLLQILGIAWVLPSVSGFLTALSVVFAPVAQSLLFRRPVGRTIWLAVAVAIVGMALLSWPKPEAAAAFTLAKKPPLPHLGEILTVLGSMIFTAQILAVDRFGQSASPVRLTGVMFFATAGLSLLVALAAGPSCFRWTTLVAIASDRTVWWTLGTLVLFSSVVALHLMNKFQPRVSPATASVVYCSEPLFATLFSLAFGAEKLTFLTILGGAAVLAAVLIVAVKPAASTTPC